MATYLKAQSGIQNGFRDLGDGTGNQKARRQDTNEGSDWQDSLNKVGEVFVGGHTDSDRGQDNLNGGKCDSNGIDGDDGSQKSLANERGHENGTQSGSRGHENRQSNISASNVSTKVRGLSSVDGTNKNHTGQHGGIQSEHFTQSQCQSRHHSVTESELHSDRNGFLHDVKEILGGKSDTHGKHQCCQCSREVLGREPSKGSGRLQGGSRKDDGPKGEESGSNTGSFKVGFEKLVSQSRCFGFWFSSVLASDLRLNNTPNSKS